MLCELAHIDPSAIRSVVLRCPNWIGDAVMATPFLQEVRALFPSATLTGLALPAITSLYEKSPFFDRLLSFSRDKKSTMCALKTIQPDLGILLTNSFSSAWMFFRARIPYRLGLRGHMRRLLLTHVVEHKLCLYKTGLLPSEVTHDVETYRLVLHAIQGGRRTGPPLPLLLVVGEEEKEQVKRLLERDYDTLSSHHRIIVINPGATYGSAKCWPIASFRALIEKLMMGDPNNRIFVTGDRTMRQMVDEILLQLPQRGYNSRAYNFCGKTNIRELMALIAIADGVVSNDSGPMHIASALRRPLVAIFGSTNPYRTGPFNGGKVIYKSVLCSPCYLRVCPIDFRCMTSISADEVYDLLMHVMS